MSFLYFNQLWYGFVLANHICLRHSLFISFLLSSSHAVPAGDGSGRGVRVDSFICWLGKNLIIQVIWEQTDWEVFLFPKNWEMNFLRKNPPVSCVHVLNLTGIIWFCSVTRSQQNSLDSCVSSLLLGVIILYNYFGQDFSLGVCMLDSQSFRRSGDYQRQK